MSSKHTPEPWVTVVAHGSKSVIIYSENNNKPVGKCWTNNPKVTSPAANAARIVACVNAFEGIDDPQDFVNKSREMRAIVERWIKKYNL